MGEKRAFDEFLLACPHFQVEELPSYSATSKVVLLTRTAQAVPPS